MVFAGVDDNGEMILEKPKRKITIHDVFPACSIIKQRHIIGIIFRKKHTGSIIQNRISVISCPLI